MIRHAKNIHELHVDGNHARIAMLSDLHWDNPKCDRVMLKNTLTTAYQSRYLS